MHFSLLKNTDLPAVFSSESNTSLESGVFFLQTFWFNADLILLNFVLSPCMSVTQIMAWRPFYSWNSVMQFWHTTQEEDNTVLPNKVLRYMYLCSSIPNFPANINHGLQNAIKRKVLVQSVREEPSMQDGPAWEFASRTPPAGELQRHVPCSYKRRDPIIKAFHWMATT